MLTWTRTAPTRSSRCPTAASGASPSTWPDPRARRAVEVAESCDVFLTSYLPELRARAGHRRRGPALGEPGDHLHPRVGVGQQGSDARHRRVRRAAAWASSGVRQAPAGQHHRRRPRRSRRRSTTCRAATHWPGRSRMALFRRERHRETSVVDVSLLNVGMWSMCPDLVRRPYMAPMIPSRSAPGNPLTNWYRTSDDRWIYLVLPAGRPLLGRAVRVHAAPRPDRRPAVRRRRRGSRTTRSACARSTRSSRAATLAEWRRASPRSPVCGPR